MSKTDELMSEWDRLGVTPQGDEGLRMEEWSKETGWSAERLTKLFRAMAQEGRLIRGRKLYRAIDGRECQSPCYRIAAAPKAGKKRKG